MAGTSSVLGWTLIGVGGLMVADVVRGINPWHDFLAVASGKSRPAPHSSSVTFGQSFAPSVLIGQAPGVMGTTVSTNASGDQYAHGGAPPSSGAAGPGTAFCRAQLGKAYVFGANGPDQWDCSSLTQHAAARCGVALPRVTTGQQFKGSAVDMSQVREGDLIFYGRPLSHHVGWAVSNSTMIHAPHTGTVVQEVPIWHDIEGPYARRIL